MTRAVTQHATSRRGTAWRAPIVLVVLTTFFSGSLLAQHQHAPPLTRRDSVARPEGRSKPTDTTKSMSGHEAHDMSAMMEGPLGISHLRMGSGTSWLPDSSPMHANHKMLGDWTVMLHGVAFGVYDHQGSERGADQVGVVDWEMVMAMRRIGTGLLHLHGMASLEPATIGARGYPLLLQTGEAYGGRPLIDRQHPHDLFMELAAMFEQPVARDLAVSVYGGAVGEPALGPVAFMHRPSAQSDPFSPLGHHWQDATHISYGVATAGVYSRRWKVEGSVFNGREPDESRWNIDFGTLDSYSGRLTINPAGRWSLAGWYGFLESPEELHPEESTHRYGASVLHSGRGWRNGEWATLLMWGANSHGGHAENSAVVESNLELGRHNTVFGRFEYVRKNAGDLVVPGALPTQEYDINSLVGGYIREVASISGGTVGVGFRASVNFVPRSLASAYGTRTPAGLAMYVRVRPKRMVMGTVMPGMSDMKDGGVSATQHMAAMRDTARMTGMHHMETRRDTAPMVHMHLDEPAGSSPADSAAAAEVVARFHRALENGDSAIAAALLTNDAVVLEGGAIESREEYLRHHLGEDIAFAKAVTTERKLVSLRWRSGVAWVVSSTTSSGERQGRPFTAAGAELMVLVRTPDGWRISAIHWSSRRRGS